MSTAAAGRGPAILACALEALDEISRGRSVGARRAQVALAECQAMAQGNPPTQANAQPRASADERLSRAFAALQGDKEFGSTAVDALELLR